MRDLLPELRKWYTENDRFAVAAVIGTFGSAPRQPGAAMAVSANGAVVGSVSGGCVEAAWQMAQSPCWNRAQRDDQHRCFGPLVPTGRSESSDGVEEEPMGRSVIGGRWR